MKPPRTRIFLLIDTSASMAGAPLMEAQSAARAFLDKCDFTRTEVGLISFSDVVTLQAEATDNARRVHAAINRLEPDGTTNLAEALALAHGRHLASEESTRRRLAPVMLTDGYPDAADAAVEEAEQIEGPRASRSWRSAPARPTSITSAGSPALRRDRSSPARASWSARSARSPG